MSGALRFPFRPPTKEVLMKPFRTLLLTAALTGALLTPAHAANLSHTVAKGDTMWKIASKYQVGTS